MTNHIHRRMAMEMGMVKPDTKLGFSERQRRLDIRDTAEEAHILKEHYNKYPKTNMSREQVLRMAGRR